MAASSSQSETREPGIIILGNSGSGKSYLCNIITGCDKFESAFRPEAVTVTTEYCRINLGLNCMRIYNIPGLVEGNQELINRNKEEIMKAFNLSPISVVMFVWTQTGGRVHNDDILAFKALNDAYKFPPESLMFVVNNIPSNRPSEYEGQFIAMLSNLLQPMSISMEDVIFVDAIQPEDKEKRKETRLKLLRLIEQHHACMQRRYGKIILQSDQLKTMRKLLSEQQSEIERDRTAFQKQIRRMTQEYKDVKKEAEKQYQQMEAKLEAARKDTERERARQEEERRQWKKREQRRQQQEIERQEEERREEEERRKQIEQRTEPPKRYLKTRDSCDCPCHSGLLIHFGACCYEDPRSFGNGGSLLFSGIGSLAKTINRSLFPR